MRPSILILKMEPFRFRREEAALTNDDDTQQFDTANPSGQQLFAAVFNALRPFPEATRKVEAAIQELLGSSLPNPSPET